MEYYCLIQYVTQNEPGAFFLNFWYNTVAFNKKQIKNSVKTANTNSFASEISFFNAVMSIVYKTIQQISKQTICIY